MRWPVAVAVAVMLISCTSSSPSASSQAPATPPAAARPSPEPSPSAEPTPSPLVFPSPTPLPVGSPVSRHVLAPAKVLPIARLCQYPVTHTADGNLSPIFCRGGAINVLAWRDYVQIGSHVMSLSRGATLLEVERAMCRDGKFFHSTKPESGYAYEISAAYYGWKYAAAISQWQDQPYDPKNVLC